MATNSTPSQALDAFRSAVSRVVLGADRPVRLLCAALLSGGHALIEDRPGTGKTTLAKAAARALSVSFKRIQFTPDLLPGDVTGGLVYLPDRGAMEFRREPFDAKAAERDIAAIRSEIRAMGTVNVNAVEDYRQLEERYTGLEAQKNEGSERG